MLTIGSPAIVHHRGCGMIKAILNSLFLFQESLSMFMMPELLPAMLSVEALEDNEVLKVEGVRMFSRISEKKQKTKIELLDQPKSVS